MPSDRIVLTVDDEMTGEWERDRITITVDTDDVTGHWDHLTLTSRGIGGPPGPGVPRGGDLGQVLGKASDDDFDTEWVDQTGVGSSFPLTEDVSADGHAIDDLTHVGFENGPPIEGKAVLPWTGVEGLSISTESGGAAMEVLTGDDRFIPGTSGAYSVVGWQAFDGFAQVDVAAADKYGAGATWYANAKLKTGDDGAALRLTEGISEDVAEVVLKDGLLTIVNEDGDVWINAAGLLRVLGGTGIDGTDAPTTVAELADILEAFGVIASHSIPDMATQAELDDASTADRARANHTGTQTLSTISDAGTVAGLNTGTAGGNVSTNTQGDVRWASAAQGAKADTAEQVANKDVVSGYAGLDTGGGLSSARQVERRFAYAQRALNLYLAASESSARTELYVGDSMGHTGASAPETTSCIAVYEAEVARAYNLAPRTVGFCPVELWTSTLGVDAAPGAMAWDTVPAGQNVARGPNYANKTILSTQSATITRTGTHVTIYYTTYRTGGAVVNVTINGTSVGTIDNRDGTIAAGVDYDSGRVATFTHPGSTFGPMTVTLTHSGTGTAFEVSGAYFYNQNVTTGFRLIRADRTGQRFSYLNDPATSPPLLQFIANRLPHIVTICLGVNDYIHDGASASTLASSLTTFVTAVRAQYSGAKPAIRYIFQAYASDWLPATWKTTYRDAMRAACITNDVLFLDAADALGDYSGASDLLDVSDDALHPNDKGHWVMGQLLAHATVKASNSLVNYFDVASASPHVTSAASSTILNTAGAGLNLARDAGAATANNNQLGLLGFQGVTDAYRTLKFGAAVRGRAEGAWTSSSTPAGVRFMTCPSGSAGATVDRGGFSEAGAFFVGSTVAGATATITAAGAASLASTLDVTGNVAVNTNKFTVTASSGNTAVAGTLAATGASALNGGAVVGTTGSPASGIILDVVGRTARRQGTVTLSNGANGTLTLPAATLIFITGPTGAFTFSGITNPVDGAHYRIINLTGQNMTVLHNVTSTAALRITSLTGADLVTTGNGAVDLDYDTGTSRWIATNFQT